jgi:hypothetical protein
MATAAALQADACDDKIACLGQRQLWIVIAQALATSVSMTATQLLDAACESGIACLEERNLLIAIAEGINQGGAGGGSGVVSDGVVDPVAAPANPAVTNWYTNTVAATAWVWPAGGAAWQQIV